MTRISRFATVWLIAGLLSIASVCSTQAADESPSDEMVVGFRQPPDSAKPLTWWHWMNGNISKQGITLDLEAMHRVGIAGFQIFQVGTGIVQGPVKYGSPEHLELLQYAAHEADRLGMEFAMHNCPGWSSSGGPWITPELSMQVLVWTETGVIGGKQVSRELPLPKAKQGYYRDAMVLACPSPANGGEHIANWLVKANFGKPNKESGQKAAEPAETSDEPGGIIDPASVLDISSSMDAEGNLNWQAPAGGWKIFRIGHTTTGATNKPGPAGGIGLECDKFSRAAYDCHFEHFFGPLFDTLRPLAAKGLAGAIIDSYETGMQNWTAAFPEEFQRRRGYDLRKYMPAMFGYVVGSPEISDRFLWDVRKTQADLMAENYYGRFAELCHEHNMKAYIEPYDPGNFDEMRVGSFPDMPMGEFWQQQPDHHSVKLAASAGHVNGRPVIGAEAFTSQSRWTECPYSMKSLGDFMYSQGLNRFVFHRYVHQPHPDVLPGMTMGPWGAHLDRTNTWFEQGKVWFNYLARCQYMLQQGRFVADLLYFTGENSPNVTPPRSKLKPQPPKSSDFDTVDADTILTRLKIENGRIVLPDGMTYRLLVMANEKEFSLELLRKVRDLVHQGMCLVVTGDKPEGIPGLSGYPASDAELRKIADELWGDLDGSDHTERTLGNGRVIWGVRLSDLLEKLNVKPDFEFTAASGKAVVNYTHRRTAKTDIYFVANRGPQSEDLICSFNVTGKQPEFWNADTGQIVAAPIYDVSDSRTRVPVQLGPSGSVFVVFRQPADSQHLVAVDKDGETLLSTTAFSAESQDRAAQAAARAAAAPKPAPKKDTNKGEAVPIPASDDPLAVEAATDAKGELLVWQNGTYQLKDSQGKTVSVKVSEVAQPAKIVGPWHVKFAPNLGAPPEITLDTLVSWSAHPDVGVKYFSGTAIYTYNHLDVRTDDLSGGKRLYLDLGRIEVLGEVLINGRSLGILWKPPFRVDITDAVHAGQNGLEVRVTNLWPNRLIGDEQFPAEYDYSVSFKWGSYESFGIKKVPEWYSQGKPKPSGQRVAFSIWKHYTADSPLLESGLLGPVQLTTAVRLQPTSSR